MGTRSQQQSILDNCSGRRAPQAISPIALGCPNPRSAWGSVPLVSKHSTYMEEALYERMVPGTGELPLLDILAALPPQLVLGIEVPQRSLADAGVGPYERVARCVEATRNLLDRLKVDAPGV
jgi:hypothetical protein